MSPIVAVIFTVDRIIGSSLFGVLARVLCARTGKSNFDVARFVSRCAILLLVVSMVLLVSYGLFSRRLPYLLLPALMWLSMGRGFNYESQKLPVIEREMNDSLTRGVELSKRLVEYWRDDRIKRTIFFFLALGFPIFPTIIILRGSKLNLVDISFILLSIFWLTWSFYFYVLYHPLSVPSPTTTEK